MRAPAVGFRSCSPRPLRSAMAVPVVATLLLGAGGCAARSGPERSATPRSYPVVVQNDNFLDVRLHLVYRTGVRHPLGTARAYAVTRLEGDAALLLHGEFRILLDLVGGTGYLVPDLVDFPEEAEALLVRVRPVLEQSYTSVR